MPGDAIVTDLYLHGLTREQLRDLLKSVVEEVLGPRLTCSDPSKLKNREQLSEFLGLSIAQIDRLTALDVIPSLKIGSSRRYVLDEVLAALREQKEDASDE